MLPPETYVVIGVISTFYIYIITMIKRKTFYTSFIWETTHSVPMGESKEEHVCSFHSKEMTTEKSKSTLRR